MKDYKKLSFIIKLHFQRLPKKLPYLKMYNRPESPGDELPLFQKFNSDFEGNSV